MSEAPATETLASSSLGRIAFVPPRYGPDVVGGAEAVLSEMAHGLAARGWDVDVLTTCAKDHVTWSNHYPEGESVDGRVTVRRFLTQTDTSGKARESIGNQILSGRDVSIGEQQLWVNDSLRVADLWHYVLDHASDYRALVLGPYMFWTTFAVSQIVPERTILMPCLHDEPAAYQDLFAPCFSGSRGLWFLSEPEEELAKRLHRLTPRHQVIGAGIDQPDGYDPEAFRKKFSVDGPFLYYAGRREWGKGWTELLSAFAALIEDTNADLKLVTSGAGPVDAPEAIAGRVIDVGFLSTEDRNNAMAAATAYVQPSALESFSRTVLEAWLAGTPVIANAGSEVVKWHIQRSKAGLTFSGEREFVEALRLVVEQPDSMEALAEPGRQYVLDNYTPSDVLDRVEQSLLAWTEVPV